MLSAVSVVVPVKRSEATIRETVVALLEQTYDGPVEVILVGDRGDSTWGPIRDLIAGGRVRILELDVDTGGRDANVKRNAGLAAARGDVLCLTDSDMVPGPDWVTTGVSLLRAGWTCAAGPMVSADDGFWGHYVDGNPVAGKTPRMAREYVADRASLGRRGHKPPVTANVFFTRPLLDGTGGLDPGFVFSYEDYEWFQRVVDSGFPILCTPRLVAGHHHRHGWRSLVREYHHAGRGCAQFVRIHRRSRLGRNRLLQLAAVLLAAALVAVEAGSVTTGSGLSALELAAGGAMAAAAVALSAVCAVREHRLGALAYPFVTLVFGLAFSTGMLAEMVHSR